MPDPDYLAFLDRRIPELHALGKGRAKADPTDRAGQAASRLQKATFPGVMALHRAREEWAYARRQAAERAKAEVQETAETS